MAVEIKSFKELSLEELYGLLKLRSDVFVVEQDCVYHDIDDKDKNALHVLLKKENTIIGYARIFKPGDYFEHASIGRVVIKATERKKEYGIYIMKASIQSINDILKTEIIQISAQTYLLEFYKKLGFRPVGNTYLEDGIPHIAMLKS